MKHQITFHVSEDIHARYRLISKRIKNQGIDINKAVPNFLVDGLEFEEKKNFKNLIKYLMGK